MVCRMEEGAEPDMLEDEPATVALTVSGRAAWGDLGE
jgi:hypothetical protein